MSVIIKNGNKDGRIEVYQILKEKLIVLKTKILFLKNSIKKNKEMTIITIFIYLFFILDYMKKYIDIMNKTSIKK